MPAASFNMFRNPIYHCAFAQLTHPVSTWFTADIFQSQAVSIRNEFVNWQLFTTNPGLTKFLPWFEAVMKTNTFGGLSKRGHFHRSSLHKLLTVFQRYVERKGKVRVPVCHALNKKTRFLSLSSEVFHVRATIRAAVLWGWYCATVDKFPSVMCCLWILPSGGWEHAGHKKKNNPFPEMTR